VQGIGGLVLAMTCFRELPTLTYLLGDGDKVWLQLGGDIILEHLQALIALVDSCPSQGDTWMLPVGGIMPRWPGTCQVL
jgi:hypothetical protein